MVGRCARRSDVNDARGEGIYRVPEPIARGEGVVWSSANAQRASTATTDRESVQFSTVQYRTVQLNSDYRPRISTVQYSTLQYNNDYIPRIEVYVYAGVRVDSPARVWIHPRGCRVAGVGSPARVWIPGVDWPARV
eukprot:2014517-Pyramimonas_sp.AAC.2